MKVVFVADTHLGFDYPVLKAAAPPTGRRLGGRS